MTLTLAIAIAATTVGGLLGIPAAVALLLVVTIASYVPARRAARIDPLAALRHH